MTQTVCAIRDIIKGDVPRIDISELLYNHSCFYLMSKTNEPGLLERLRFEVVANKLYNTMALNIIASSLYEMSISKIRYAIIKGAVLSKRAYEDIGFRRSCDLDILIEQKNVDYVKEVLLLHGFVQGQVINGKIVPFDREKIVFYSSSTHQLAPFVKSTNNALFPFVTIDLNLSIIWGQSKETINMSTVFNNICIEEINKVEFFSLEKEMDFIAICLHHYKDMNSLFLLYMGKLKLNLFSDIYFYLINQKPDAKKLIQLSSALNVSRYVFYCIYYANLIFDDPVLALYLKEFDIDDQSVFLNSYGLTDNERKTWSIDFFDRLFSPDLRPYLREHLNKKELQNIYYNLSYM